ncbi:glycosyltransferase family 2 protein [Candidatus Dojkabacteria bacterium]|nr:glycosyltransferase family 2 protein [Candidatus Dojkabacteria bacterium]
MTELNAVVIPAFNEADRLPALLNSCIRQLPADALCLIINNASTDATEDIIRRYTLSDGRVVGIFEDNKGIGSARQRGLAWCKGNDINIAVTTDADCIIRNSKWFGEHVTALNRPNIACTIGPIKYIPDEVNPPFTDNLYLYLYSFLANSRRRVKAMSSNVHASGANMGFRINDAINVGGYNAQLNLGEDSDLAAKLARYGDLHFTQEPILTSPRRLKGQGIFQSIIGKFLGDYSRTRLNFR